MQWVDEEMDAFADDSELLGVLFDQLLHAHALDTAIAGAAVLLADVVIDSRAAAAVRAALTVTLAEAATAALREEALDPQGFVSTEAVLRQQTDSERAVRQAVRGGGSPPVCAMGRGAASDAVRACRACGRLRRD